MAEKGLQSLPEHEPGSSQAAAYFGTVDQVFPARNRLGTFGAHLLAEGAKPSPADLPADSALPVTEVLVG